MTIFSAVVLICLVVVAYYLLRFHAEIQGLEKDLQSNRHKIDNGIRDLIDRNDAELDSLQKEIQGLHRLHSKPTVRYLATGLNNLHRLQADVERTQRQLDELVKKKQQGRGEGAS